MKKPAIFTLALLAAACSCTTAQQGQSVSNAEMDAHVNERIQATESKLAELKGKYEAALERESALKKALATNYKDQIYSAQPGSPLPRGGFFVIGVSEDQSLKYYPKSVREAIYKDAYSQLTPALQKKIDSGEYILTDLN